MRATIAAALLLACAAAASPQNSPDDQARRLLQDGRGYWKDGKHKQALDNFNTIVSGFPNTDSVDDALLEIGRYYAEVENDDRKARQSFEQVAQHFPQSDGAPGAYFYLGWLTLKHAASPAEIDDALAQFTRVQRLYPRSDWVPRALHASGLALLRAGKLAESVTQQRRVAMEYPASDVAPAAQFQVGQVLALQGQPLGAMEEFQQVRNRFPGSPDAARALERTTALYRLFGSAQPRFALDSSYRLPAGDVLKDVRAILMAPDGTLWIASDKAEAAVPFDPQGKIGPSLSGKDPRSLSVSPSGEIVLTAKTAVRLGPRDIKSFAVPERPGEIKPLDDLLSAAKTRGGSLLIADKGRKRVYRYDRDYVYQQPFPDDREREVVRMLIDPEGNIVWLDLKAGVVEVLSEQGVRLRSLSLSGAGYQIRKPADVAVDPFRNVYVADEEGAVYVIATDGRLLATVGRDVLRKPVALTLGSAGEIYVYEEKEKQVLRFQHP